MYQIYRIVNKNNGKCYIGKSVDYQKRFEQHKTHARDKLNRCLYDAINKHGIDTFSLELLENNIEDSVSDERERFWIKEYNSVSPNGYNMTEGGGGGDTLSRHPNKIHIIEQQRLKRLGQKRNDQQKRRMAEAAQGKTLSEETKRKISEHHKKNGISPPEHTKWVRGQLGSFVGKQHTNKSKQKMRVAKLGKSYEEIYGEKEATNLKEEKRKNFLKERNPRFIPELTPEQQKEIAQFCLENKNILLSFFENKYNISNYVLSKTIKNRWSINNFQKLKMISDDEWKSFWRNILNAY